MEFKRIDSLKVGDILERNQNHEKYSLKEVIRSDDEGDNYGFDGFFVQGKILNKFFKSGQSGIFVFNT